MGLVAITGFFTGAGTPSLAATVQFYSWVTSSGEMGLTDDPGQIPPANARGPVSVHHYRETPRASPIRPEPPSSPAPSTPRESGAAMVDVVDAEVPDLMDILLEQPEQSLAAHYDWVPLASPVSVWSAPVYGFWSNRTVANPSAALARYLRQLQKLVPSSLQDHWTRQAPPQWNSATFAQAGQDRHSLSAGLRVARASVNSRAIAPAPASRSRCCPMNHPDAGGRRSASRR